MTDSELTEPLRGRTVDGTEPLRGRTVCLCVTGSIAAYKAVELARLLVKAGAKVLPVMTASAARFVGPITLAGVCGEAVATNMWDAAFAGEMHVQLAERADVVAIVPATADILARLAHGRSDDLVTALALTAKGPVLAAPAMHPRMWSHPATRRNVAELLAQGRVALVGPEEGQVASGEEGMGRMAEPAAIAMVLTAMVASARPNDAGVGPAAQQDFRGQRVLVTAGPTLEDIDPVRFLGNRSTGKMGFAVAERACARGADVTLVAGPVRLPTPPGVRRIDVRSALEMRAALWDVLLPDLGGADALIMAAAVADHRPADVAPTKIKKSDAKATIELVKNPDLLAEIGAARATSAARPSRPVLVGFAVEAGDTRGVGATLFAYARRKLEEKRVDMVVCNDAADAFGRDDNCVGILTATTPRPDRRGDDASKPDEAPPSEPAAESLPRASKAQVADAILDRVRALLA